MSDRRDWIVATCAYAPDPVDVVGSHIRRTPDKADWLPRRIWHQHRIWPAQGTVMSKQQANRRLYARQAAVAAAWREPREDFPEGKTP
jgi:hypothetical protein